MSKISVALAVAIVASSIFSIRTTCNAADEKGKVVVVAHVDVLPPHTAAATELLKKYRNLSMTESGVEKVAVLQQIGRPNHFTIVEEWSSQKTLDEHASAQNTKQFRTELQPMLGAPYDERSHTELE